MKCEKCLRVLQPAKGGSVILWSRYGKKHAGFGFSPPPRIFGDQEFVSRADLGKVGYVELDFLERWYTKQPDVWTVLHTYPRTQTEDVANDGPFPANALLGYAYLIWPKSDANDDDDTTYPITYGIEIAPGHSPSVRYFVNGSRISLGNDGHRDYVQGAAYILALVSHIHDVKVSCDQIRSTSVELDHIRYYKPKNSY